MSEDERAEKIKYLENLWKEKTGKSLKDFDAAINKKFDVISGRDSLDKWSMEEIEKGLLSL